MKTWIAIGLLAPLWLGCGGPILKSQRIKAPNAVEPIAASNDDPSSGVPYFLPFTVLSVGLEVKLTKDAKADCDKTKKACLAPIEPKCKDGCKTNANPAQCAADCVKEPTKKCGEAHGKCTKEAGDNVYAAILTIKPEVVGDPERMFRLTHDREGMAHDDVKLKVNDKGLLTSITATADDRTGPIIQAIVETGINLFKFAAQVVDADDDAKLLEKLRGKHSKVISLREVIAAGGKKEWRIPKSTSDAKLVIEAERLSGTAPTDTLADDQSTNGIFAATPVPYRLTAKLTLNDSPYSQVQLFAMLPDGGPVVALPVDRTPFVKVKHTITLANGMLASVDIDRPSPVEGFVQIPLEISRRIVSLPGELIKLRYDGPAQDLEGQKKLVTLQAELEKARTALAEAQKAPPAVPGAP